MNILVLEDITEQRERLVRLIERNFWDSRVYSVANVKEAEQMLKKRDIDLFFLDIELPDGLGIDFAKKIRNNKKYALTGIIYITANIIYMIDAFKNTHCYDFLVKPYDEQDIINIIQLFCKDNNIEKEGKSFLVNMSGAVKTKVYIEDIIFIEYSNRSCSINTKHGNIVAKGVGLNKILEKIDDTSIIQCHKAFALNRKYVNDIKRIDSKIWEASFWNCKDIIPIGYKYKNQVLENIK